MISDRDLMVMVYERMLLARLFDEEVRRLFLTGRMHGTTHLSLGEEAVGVGVGAALEETDFIVSTHRGHAQDLGKGMDPRSMMAEMFGKATGCSGGRGGSMHMADPARGVLISNGIVGGGIPLATGVALGIRMKGLSHLVACFFGDGACNQGAFHESLNLAAVWDLPVLYVCVNNRYSCSTPISAHVKIDDLSMRAASYGIRGASFDGNDVEAVYCATKEAAAYVRETGPVLLVFDTYRISGHSKSDEGRYRNPEEVAIWKERCPIKKQRRILLERAILTEKEIEQLEERGSQRVAEAVAFAEASPDPVPADALKYVYR